MNLWEYHTEKFETSGFMGGILDVEAFNNCLNRLGQQGWELVNTFDTNMSHGQTRFIIAIFKRPV